MSFSDNERAVIEKVRRGEIAKFAESAKLASEIIDASLIRSLMLGLPLPLDTGNEVIPAPCGVRIQGAIIKGSLDLENGRGANGTNMPGLVLTECVIADGIDISYAQLGALSIKGSKISMLRGVRAVIAGEMVADGIEAVQDGMYCYLALHSLQVDGDVQISYAKLREKTERGDGGKRIYALYLRKATINGDLYIRNTICSGTIDLSQINVVGNVSLRNSCIRPCLGETNAIFAEGATIRSAIAMRTDADDEIGPKSRHSEGFEAFGTIDLSRAHLGAVLFDAGKVVAASEEALAIKMTGSQITGGLFFRYQSRITGEVKLDEVTVGANFESSGAYFSTGFSAKGLSVGGELDLIGIVTENAKIELCDSHVGGVIKIKDLAADIDLARAQTKTLDDGGQCERGPDRHTYLDGFVYERLEKPAENGKSLGGISEQRLQWLYCQSKEVHHNPNKRGLEWLSGAPRTLIKKADYRPQPFMQLSHVLKMMGYDSEAREIMRAKLWMETRHASLLSQIPLTLFGWIFGFGYASTRAMICLIGYFLLGWAGAHLAERDGFLIYIAQPPEMYAMRNDPPVSLVSEIKHGAVKYAPTLPVAEKGIENLPCREVDAYGYALDLMIPLIDLHVEDRCEVRRDKNEPRPYNVGNLADAGWEWLNNPSQAFRGPEWALPAPTQIWRAAHVVYAMIGWLMVSLSILTFSGLLRQKEHIS